ncbi:FAD-dependent oxidoreductase [Rhodobacterales bacterium]|nr:FAD-dependent oxidoreductase [Rhodobacterales bacterium]
MPKVLIVGAGPSGLYAAWRLLKAQSGYEVTIVEMSPDRIGGRIHTKTFAGNNYVDLGGMRYASDQQVINKVIQDIGYPASGTADFVEADDRLFYLRGQHIYTTEINTTNPVPYNTPYNNAVVDVAFNNVAQAVINGASPNTREEWCNWVETVELPNSFPSDVYNENARVSTIGYWNLLFDFLHNEGYHYCADAGGYQSNVINWNAADAIPYNGEFGASVEYSRFKGGYTSFINALHKEVIDLNGGQDPVILDQRLVSFDTVNNQIVATCENTSAPGNISQYTTDYLFLCMPRNSVELIAQSSSDGMLSRKLNEPDVKLLVESVIEQPSYKVGISCSSKWWENADYPPRLNSPANAWGPTITDLPLRQIYYFDPEEQAESGHAILASYDDERYTGFWQQLELPTGVNRTIPISENYEPLSNGAAAPIEMQRMLALQLAQVHYHPNNVTTGYQTILNSITEAYYMDWSLNPFGAGYHAWAAHYDICEVMNEIRRPLANVDNSVPAQNVFLVGSAYSNDQAWVEGAFCTTESVLIDYFNFTPIVNTASYPLICSCTT